MAPTPKFPGGGLGVLASGDPGSFEGGMRGGWKQGNGDGGYWQRLARLDAKLNHPKERPGSNYNAYGKI